MSPDFDQLPSAIRRNGRLARLGSREVPALLVTPEGTPSTPPPMVLWLHGRTANKELDPGRYLRLMRSGIAVCAVDLPGHGERSLSALQQSGYVLEVVLQMMDELDEVTEAALDQLAADPTRVGIGGMSAGGMVTLARLCHNHSYKAAWVEATTGNWRAQARLPMLRASQAAAIASADPIEHLDTWQEVPLHAVHCRADEWVPFEGQQAFIKALQDRYSQPDLVEFTVYDKTGALHEHAGFGIYSAEVKELQRLFFVKQLGAELPEETP